MKILVAQVLILVSLLSWGQSKQPFRSLDVFELEWVSDPQISPDGQQIAYLRNGMDIMTDRRFRRIWLINADGSDHQKLTSRDVSESSPRWSPDGTRLAFSSSTDQGSELFVYWVRTGKLARLTQLDRSPRNLAWSPDGQWLAFTKLVPEKAPFLTRAPTKPKGAKWADPPRVTTRVRHERDGSGFIEPGYNHHFVVPAEGGSPRQVTSGNFQHSSAPVWSRDGKYLVFSANRSEDWEYQLRESNIYRVGVLTGQVEALTERNGPDYGPAISPDGKTIAYLGYEDRVQTYQLPEISLMDLDGGNKRTVSMDLDRNPAMLRWDSKGQGLFFRYDSEGNTKLGYVSTSGKFRNVASNVGGASVARPYGGGSYSIAENDALAYNITRPEYPADLAISMEGKERRLTELNKELLDFRELGAVETIWYNSSFDDRRIQGWLVKPPDFDAAKKYPLLVENHGGPIANYGDRFSPEMQLYASAGYVVFYPNPRGSTSYGQEFGNLLYHNYPGQDYDDVMSGVDAVVAKGYIDEQNLFVTGGSAGGIMTAWMIGKSQKFRAAAVIKPVMNWYSKTLVADNWNGYYHYRYPGYPWENPEAYLKFSPISLVGNIETPTLVMVGTSDLRTPLSEAKQLYHSLKQRKIQTALVEVPGAFHFIANRPSQLITKIDHIVAWFERYRE